MRLFVDMPLAPGAEGSLPEGAARHAMVRRVQPGDTLTLFDGGGSDWPAVVLAVTRSAVTVRVGPPQPVQRELATAVTVALVMPANERMDILVEKATELGVARIQPLVGERSVLRLTGERAERKRVHWQGVAQAACEQCGRAVVPTIAPLADIATWLRGADVAAAGARWLLSLQPGAATLPGLGLPGGATVTLSGPEGGLSADEEAAARAAGFRPVDLGPRVLRAETAPLAVLAWLALMQTDGTAAPRP